MTTMNPNLEHLVAAWPRCPDCGEVHDISTCTDRRCDCCLALEDAGVIL